MSTKDKIREMFQRVGNSQDGIAPTIETEAEQEATQVEADLHDQHTVILPHDGGLPDARLKFGPHKGKLVSRLARTAEGINYLIYILHGAYPAELKEVIGFHINKHAENGFTDTEIRDALFTPFDVQAAQKLGQSVKLFGHSLKAFKDVLKYFPRLPNDER